MTAPIIDGPAPRPCKIIGVSGAAMRNRRQDTARSAGATAMTDLDRDGLETVTMGNRGFPEIGRTVHLPGCGRPTGSRVEADPP